MLKAAASGRGMDYCETAQPESRSPANVNWSGSGNTCCDMSEARSYVLPRPRPGWAIPSFRSPGARP